MIYRILRSRFLRFTCGVCWKTSSSHDWNHVVLFLGLVPIVACTDCLPDKRLANTFHRRISPRPPANFRLVVSTVLERWVVLFANHQVLYIYVKLHPPLFRLVAVPGEGKGGPGVPLIFGRDWGPKGRKNVLGDRSPPTLSSSQGLDPPLRFIVVNSSRLHLDLRLVRSFLLISAITYSFTFFSGKLVYKCNRKLFSCICIAWYKHSRGSDNLRQLCKPETNFVSGLHNCRKFSQSLSCLYQAMQIQKTFSIA